MSRTLAPHDPATGAICPLCLDRLVAGERVAVVTLATAPDEPETCHWACAMMMSWTLDRLCDDDEVREE